jgi:hypothetical protein
MKLKLRSFLLVLAGTAIIYSGCKKAAKTTADPALAPQDVASQVALNIDQSLFGGLGLNISGGLSAPTSFAVHTKGKILQSLTNPDCSLVIDTTMSYADTTNGGTATIAGTFKFSYACSNNVVSGYTTNDNLVITLVSPSLNLNYKVAENLTLLSADPTNPDANITLSGSLNSNGSYQYNTGTKRSGTEVFDYTLTSIILSPLTGEVASGTATFNTSGSGPKGVWNYQGTITFLGNQTATVTINGKTYTVNLDTGGVG